jgi:hypothetical protein
MPVSTVYSRNLPERRVSLGKLVWSTSIFHPISPHQLTRPFSFRRIRSLEAHVADIRQTQVAIQSSLTEIVSHLRIGLGPIHRSPSVYQPPPFTPDLQSQGSPATAAASTPTNPSHPHPPQLMVDTHGPHQQQMVAPGHQPQSSVISPPSSRPPLSAQQSSGSFHPIIGGPGHRPPGHAGELILCQSASPRSTDIHVLHRPASKCRRWTSSWSSLAAFLQYRGLWLYKV